jgi:hypothetical protein
MPDHVHMMLRIPPKLAVSQIVGYIKGKSAIHLARVKAPVWIQHPEGAYTGINRDVFGKPLSIRRRDANGAVSVTRSYVYDSYQQLCKTVEPETGATANGYDAAGNLVWSAAGLSLPSTTSCDADSAFASGRGVDRSYDVRNRIKALSFPDGNGNQAWSYWPDGAVKQ